MDYTKLWLERRRLAETRRRIIISCDHALCDTAAFDELKTAMSEMVPDAIVLIRSEVFDTDSYLIVLDIRPELETEEYSVAASSDITEIAGGSERGLLYGVFAFLRQRAGISCDTA